MRHYKGNPNLKCAGVQMQYSADQIAERIKCTQDPEYFIETYLKIIHVDKGLVPFKLYDFQKTLLKAYTDNRFVIAKLPRQVGKSTVTVAYIMWVVLFGPMQNIAILANKASTARDILGKLQLAYEHIPLWMQQGITSWNRGSIEIENGSKVVAASTAKSSIRGNTYNCVSGNSTTKIKIDGEEIEISFAQLYEIIANSSKYKCNKFNDEIQYVHRQQIQENLFPNNTSGHGANNANYWNSGETPYYTKMYGRKRCGQQFSIFNHKGAHISPSAIAQNGIDNESQEIAFICSLSDDIRKTRPSATVRYSKTESIASAIESGPENSSHWEKTHRGDKEKNWFGAFRENSFGRTKIQTINSNDRETIRHQEARGIFTKNICGADWEKEDNRTRQQDKQESRKNKEDGRGSSWNEAERRVKNENEPGCQRTNSLEQRKSRNIFSRSSEKNEGCKSWYSFNRRTQNEFEKIQILTEKGYKNFHGIKKTAQQNTIKLTIECGEIVCTPDHKLFSDIGYVEAKNCLGISVLNHNGLFYKITDIQQNHKIDVYDLLEVEDTHSYYCNNFLVHQCIFLDEFAFVPTNIAEEFITSVYPTISSGATTKLFMVSTPNGMNLFYKYWTDAINKRNLYVPIEAHWSVVPGRDAQWAADQIKQLGQEKFNQEFLCEFLGSSNTLIAPSKLGAMPWRPPLQKIGDIDVYELPQPKHIYMMCVDTAEGQNLDYSAFAVIDVTECPYRLVAKYKNNQISPMMFPNIIFNVAEKYNSAHVLVETNSIGIQVAEILHTDLEYENIFSTTNLGRGGQKISAGFKKNSKLGVKTTAPMKSLGCSNLKSIVEGNKFIIQDFDTIAELTSFVATGKNYAAEPGCHDDLVMTLVMFAWLAAQPLFKELTDVDIRRQMIEGREHSLQEQLLPFGIISDGADVSKVKKTFKDESGQNWEIVERWENNKRLWDEFDYVGDQDGTDTNDDW